MITQSNPFVKYTQRQKENSVPHTVHHVAATCTSSCDLYNMYIDTLTGRAEEVKIITSRAPSFLYSPTQPSESAFVSIRTLRSCSYAHLWNISCCSEIQCRIGTSQKAWRSARRFPLAAIVKSNISACAYRGQEC